MKQHPDYPQVSERSRFRPFDQYARSQHKGTRATRKAGKRIVQRLKAQLRPAPPERRPDSTYPYIPIPADQTSRRQRRWAGRNGVGVRRQGITREYVERFHRSEAIHKTMAAMGEVREIVIFDDSQK